MKIVALLLALTAKAAAHVTLVPNYGAGSGNYFQFAVKIPHGEGDDLETTKIEITVPHGVKTVKPEAVFGWEIQIDEREACLGCDHDDNGDPIDVDMGPAKITYTAKCTTSGSGSTCDEDHAGLHNDHLMLLSMQIKLGCHFGADTVNSDGTLKATPVSTTGTSGDATVWEGQHTLWWKVAQYTSTKNTNDGNDDDPYKDWADVKENNDMWHASYAPSPYLFIYSDANKNCPNGMMWGADSEVIPLAADQDPIKTKAEVLSMMNEETFDLKDSMTALETDMNKRLADIESDKIDIKHCAISAICLAAILMVSFITLCVFRVTKPAHFREYLLSVPLIHEGGRTYPGEKTVEIGAV